MFGSMQMAVSRVIKLQHHRIAQVLEVGGTRLSLAYTVWSCRAGQSQSRDFALPDKCTLVHGARRLGAPPGCRPGLRVGPEPLCICLFDS